MRPGKFISVLVVLFGILPVFLPARQTAAAGNPTTVDMTGRLPDPDSGQPPSLVLSTLTVTVLDAAGQDTLVTRCSVLNLVRGSWYPTFPPFQTVFYHTSEGGYFYSSGTFTVNVPAGTTMVRIGRGPEYTPISSTLVTSGDTTVSYQLSRTIDMSDCGWYSGDCHVHIAHSGGVFQLEPEDALFLGRAEGLGVVNCLDNGFFFTGGPDPVSTPDCIVYMSEEYRSGTWGHLGLLGLSQIFRPDWSHWWPLNLDVAFIIQFQPGAAVIAAHPVSTDDFQSFDSWPGNGLARELPVDIIGGDIDAFEVLSYSNCHPGNIELDMYYRLLNCGFKLAAAAGTDAGMNRNHDRPLGGFRTYVHIPDGPFTFETWLAGLKKGRTFITNGPLITRFDLQGLLPGDSLRLPGGIYRVCGRLSAQCDYPMGKVEIIQNGEVALSFEIEDGRDRIDESFHLFIDRSCWIAARITGVDSMWHVIGDSLFAHTSPIYFQLDRQRVVVEEDAEYFVDWIEDLEALAQTQGEWPSPRDSIRIFGLFAGAREFYSGLAGLASGAGPLDYRLGAPGLLLRQNRPNPFSTGTWIEFVLPETGSAGSLTLSGPKSGRRARTDLTIYDVRGRAVKHLFGGELPPGRHRCAWDGRDDRGKPVASGVYFYRVQSGGLKTSLKMLLIK